MLEKTIRKLLRRRHFWRDINFDELSNLYTSMMLRSFAINMTGIFVPIYMLRLGYDFTDIIQTFFWYFVARAVFSDYIAGLLTAKIGPKHTILVSYVVLLASTIQFLILPTAHWPLWLLGGVWGASSSLFFIPFHAEFSKIKHPAHGGKELGYVNIVDKAGGIVGPLLGGLVATLFGGQYIFLVACAMLVLGGLPLLRNRESLPQRQKLSLLQINYHTVKADLRSFSFYGVEMMISVWMWPVYLALFILGNEHVYTSLGILVSVSVAVSILTAYLVGRLIDARHGRIILRYGTIINSLIHLARPFVMTYPGALVTNVLNEGATVMYRLPYLKGMYDSADATTPSYRISYFTLMEMSASYVRAIVLLTILFASTALSARNVLDGTFYLAAIASLLIMTERFRALNRKAKKSKKKPQFGEVAV